MVAMEEVAIDIVLTVGLMAQIDIVVIFTMQNIATTTNTIIIDR
jgi:hypothetical protein